MTRPPRPEERRRHRRIAIRMVVEYEHLSDFLADYTANVSLGGMFIRSERPLDMGTRFKLRFRVPGRTRPVETLAEVRWVSPPGSPEPGMGVSFEELAPADERAVRAWLQEWEA